MIEAAVNTIEFSLRERNPVVFRGIGDDVCGSVILVV